MRELSDARAMQASIRAGYARDGRNIEMFRDVKTTKVRFYDHDYGVELGSLDEARLGWASRNEVMRLVQDACREPTALEILYYAQVGGPHVMGGMP